MSVNGKSGININTTVRHLFFSHYNPICSWWSLCGEYQSASWCLTVRGTVVLSVSRGLPYGCVFRACLNWTRVTPVPKVVQPCSMCQLISWCCCYADIWLLSWTWPFPHPSVSSLLLGYRPSRPTSQPGSVHCCMDTCPGLEKEMLHMTGLAGWGLRQVTGLDYDPMYLMVLACISFAHLI